MDAPLQPFNAVPYYATTLMIRELTPKSRINHRSHALLENSSHTGNRTSTISSFTKLNHYVIERMTRRMEHKDRIQNITLMDRENSCYNVCMLARKHEIHK
jgi:hypothetical protein